MKRSFATTAQIMAESDAEKFSISSHPFLSVVTAPPNFPQPRYIVCEEKTMDAYLPTKVDVGTSTSSKATVIRTNARQSIRPRYIDASVNTMLNRATQTIRKVEIKPEAKESEHPFSVPSSEPSSPFSSSTTPFFSSISSLPTSIQSTPHRPRRQLLDPLPYSIPVPPLSPIKYSSYPKTVSDEHRIHDFSYWKWRG